MKSIKKLMTLGLASALILLGLFLWQLQQPISLPAGQERLEFDIPHGSSSIKIARQLEAEGIIPSQYLMRLYLRLTKKGRALKAGEYALTPELNLISLVDMLEQGKSIQYNFTIVEGWNIRELLAALKQHPHIRWTLPAQNTAAVLMRELGEPELHPEGVFLPETYLFPRGTTDVQFLQRARSAMKETLAEAWAGRGENTVVKTPYEALILASIVEKETAVPAERPLIAGVFSNRLRIGMRLQTDPTVIYGIGPSYDGDIRFRDLRTDTPYNTYTRYGLTPTPIAMPGRDAIHAALHPAETKALYFVSRNDGTHIFSETLAAHEAAVDKFQRNR